MKPKIIILSILVIFTVLHIIAMWKIFDRPETQDQIDYGLMDSKVNVIRDNVDENRADLIKVAERQDTIIKFLEDAVNRANQTTE